MAVHQGVGGEALQVRDMTWLVFPALQDAEAAQAAIFATLQDKTGTTAYATPRQTTANDWAIPKPDDEQRLNSLSGYQESGTVTFLA